jgi:rubredoxin
VPTNIPPSIYKGIKYRTELEARWAVAFDELGVECSFLPVYSLMDCPDWLSFKIWDDMYARVFYCKPSRRELDETLELANKTQSEILMLVGMPAPKSYFTIAPSDSEYAMELSAYGNQYKGNDYLIFDSTTSSEGRFYVCTGADASCFPSPIESEDFESDADDLALVKTWHHQFDRPFTGECLDLSKVGFRRGENDFGAWIIDGDELVLKRDDSKCIDFEQCNSSAQILDWIFHYQGRITAEELADMIVAIQTILHPAKNFCSFGQDKRANGLQLLREWLTPPTPKRQPIKPSIRFQVLKRDDYRCQMCGATAQDGAKLEIDHIHPVSKGGGNELSNLQVLCRDCNAGKRDQLQ